LLLAPAAFAADEMLSDTGQKSDVANRGAEQLPPASSEATDQSAAQQQERATLTAKEPHILKASEVIGYSVQNLEGQELGTIEELVIDLQSGQVVYAALATGGFLGVGDKLFAIPWRAMKLMPEQQSFSVDVTKETLENAPGFDKDDWPKTSARTGTNVP
jgi:sporulation protein YlmC with PRC-barrel domain